ncbi:MAG: XrtA/PEP-CTERM system histidine kinase PrsK [Nitrospirota bacterium]
MTTTMLYQAPAIAAAVLALAFSVHTLARRERTPSSFALSAALAAGAALELFDLMSVLEPQRLALWKRLGIIAEAFLPPSWLFFSLTFSRDWRWRSSPVLQRALAGGTPFFLIVALLIPPGGFFASPDFAAERMLFLGTAGFFYYLFFVAYMVVALATLEGTLVSAGMTARWKIKLQVLGAGAMIAVLLFYYSQAFLYRSINMNLLPVRSLVLMLGIALIAYAQARRGSGGRVQVSKQMAYRSVVIFMVGLYFIGLGLLGEGMRYFGGSAQKALALALAFVAGIALATALLSETFKRKITVLLHKHFYITKYDYRIQWLKFTDRLSSAGAGEEVLKAMLLEFCETFGAEGAALFLYDRGKGGYCNTLSLEMPPVKTVVAHDSGLVELMRERRWVVTAGDDRPPLTEEGSRFLRQHAFSFVVPLMANGVLEGFIAMGRPINASERYTYEDYDLMKTFGRHAAWALLNFRLADELARSREMETVGRIATFVVHDLKNLISTLSLVTENAHEYIDDPAFQKDMLRSLRTTMEKMRRLTMKLRNIEETPCLSLETADLSRVVAATVAMVSNGGVSVRARSVYARIDSEAIQKVLLNLILNALEATGGKGPVAVELGGAANAFIRVADAGCGMTEEFQRDRLFKPFSTTKRKGLGIGLYHCKHIVEAHGGRIDVVSEVGKGSSFTVHLPAAQETACVAH